MELCRQGVFASCSYWLTCEGQVGWTDDRDQLERGFRFCTALRVRVLDAGFATNLMRTLRSVTLYRGRQSTGPTGCQ